MAVPYFKVGTTQWEVSGMVVRWAGRQAPQRKGSPMTTYLVTGASGHLGRLTVQALLDLGVTPSDVVATARNTDAIDDLAALGVVTRAADYTDPVSLKEALV